MAPLNLHLLPGVEIPGSAMLSQIEQPGPVDVLHECPCDRAVLLSYGFGWTQGTWPPPQGWFHRVDAKSKPCRACEVLQRRRPLGHRVLEKEPWEDRHHLLFAAGNEELHPNYRSYFDRMRESPPPLPRGTPRTAEGLPISWKLHEVRPPPPPKPQSLVVFQESFRSHASQSISASGFRKKSPGSPEKPADEKGSPPLEKAKKKFNEVRQPKKKPNSRYVKPHRPVGYIKLPEVGVKREGRPPGAGNKWLTSSPEGDSPRRNDPASPSEKTEEAGDGPA